MNARGSRLFPSEALFTGCAACNYLHRLLETTPRSEVEQAHAIRLRLGLAHACCSHPVMVLCNAGSDSVFISQGQHFGFQAAQRLAIARSEELCRRSGGKSW